MLAENFVEQGGGRRNPDGFRGRQRSYSEFNATDVKVSYWILVLLFHPFTDGLYFFYVAVVVVRRFKDKR